MEAFLEERLGLPAEAGRRVSSSALAHLREQLADSPSGWSTLEDALRRDHLRWLLPGLRDGAVDLLVTLSDGLTPPSGGAPVADDGSTSPSDADGANLDGPTSRGRGVEQTLTDAAEATVQLGRLLEATQVEVLAAMATVAGRRLLRTEHGTDDPAGLSRTRRERWRARTKSVVANEFQVLSGYGIQDCHDRVGFALAPRTATAAADAALRRGDADWWQVWQWWKRCRSLDPGRAGDVCHLVFGPPVPPGGAAPPARRPSRREFLNLLDREATRVEGTDAVAARERRHRAVEERRADASVDADGTGCFRVIGRTSAVVAAMDRVDTIARRARAAGDSRSLDQLRSDTALALLMGGVLPSVQRVAASAAGGPDPVADDDTLDVARGGGWEPAEVDRLTALLSGHPPAVIEVVVPLDVLTGASPDGVALLTGHGSLTGEHVREIALAPGTTFYRLVTDPASGRLLDRSVSSYAPDADLRAVIAAADRYCRGPGCTMPATRSEVDHVLEHPAGPTSLGNLASAHSRHHGMKTNKWWSCVMEPNSRVVRWTTFFGRTWPTLPFDYSSLTGRAGSSPTTDTSDEGNRGCLADLQDQLVYAALAARPPGSTLSAGDDGPDSWCTERLSADVHTGDGDGDGADGDGDGADGDGDGDGADGGAPDGDTDPPAVRLTHTPPGGEPRPGAPAGQPSPEELVEQWGISSPGGAGRGGNHPVGDARDQALSRDESQPTSRDRDDEPPPF
jgi:hypothetical protein